jgi:uncharacterized repeat protein (TIGR01451 family)
MVWVEGVVIADSYAFGSNTRYFIEDPGGGPWSGLYIYNGGDKPAVDEGDFVQLYGQVDEYFGITQLSIRNSIDGIQRVLSTGNALPAPEVITTGLYGPDAAATAEAYESVLIEFQGATVTDDNLGFGEWAFDDGSGAAHADDWSSALTYQPANGDQYRYIRGVGDYSFGDYKLAPRYDADVALVYLNIAKSAPPNVSADETFTYTITVENELGFDLTGVVVTDAVPANATFAYALDGGVESSGVVSWTAATLTDTDSLTVRFVVTATGGDGAAIVNDDYAVAASNLVTPVLGDAVLTQIGSYMPVYTIQGSGARSVYVGQSVKTVGIVVGFFEGNYSGGGTFDGFYIQDATGDGDGDTSDAIFVNHGSLSISVNVGDQVTVTGQVQEFSEYDGASCTGDECLTQVAVSSAGDVVVGGTGSASTVTLDPPGDPISATVYWESLEGMLVSYPSTCTVVGPTNYGTIVVVRGDLGVDRVLRSGPYAGMPVGVRHYELYGDIGGADPDNLIVGSVVQNVDGPLAFSYGNYIVTTQQGDAWQTVTSQPAPSTPSGWPAAGEDEFTVATFNTYNFDHSSEVAKVVSTVVEMNGPVFLALQEIDVGTVITDLLGDLAAAGYDYGYAYSHPDVGGHGVALLWRTDRVTNTTWSTAYQGCSTFGSSSSEAYDSYCPAADEYPLFSRRPVVVTATVTMTDTGDREVVVIANHFKSKLGGAAADQRRLEQGQFIASLVDGLVSAGSVNVIVLGDLNDFEDSAPLQAMTASGNLVNLWSEVPAENRYSYIYNGVSQVLDHILISTAMEDWLQDAGPLHYNADFPYKPFSDDDTVVWRTSDHDPVLATFGFLPSLSIAKEADPKVSVTYHGVATYTIVLTNSGTGSATGVQVTDTLPVSTTFAYWVEQPAGAGESGDEITWSGTVTAGEAITFTFAVTHTGDYGEVITNTVEYSHASSSGSAEVSFSVVDRSLIYLPLIFRSYSSP